MARQSGDSREDNERPRFPYRPDVWDKIRRKLVLTPMHARIVEQMLRRLKCKEIAAELGVEVCTVRTYLSRIYDRNNVEDQTELFIHIMALSQDESDDARPSNE